VSAAGACMVRPFTEQTLERPAEADHLKIQVNLTCVWAVKRKELRAHVTIA